MVYAVDQRPAHRFLRDKPSTLGLGWGWSVRLLWHSLHDLRVAGAWGVTQKRAGVPAPPSLGCPPGSALDAVFLRSHEFLASGDAQNY